MRSLIIKTTLLCTEREPMNTTEKARKLFNRGLWTMRTGAYQAAIAHFDKVLALQPSDNDLLVEITRLRKNARQYAGLEIVSPVDLHMRVEANRERGKAALETAAYANALCYFALVLKDDPADKEANALLKQAKQNYGKPVTLIEAIMPHWSITYGMVVAVVGMLGVLLFLGLYRAPSAMPFFAALPEHTATPSPELTATRRLPTPTPTPAERTPEVTGTPRPATATRTPTARATPSPSATAQASVTPTALPIGIVAEGVALNVRAEPGTDAPLQNFQLASGDRVEIVSSARGSGCAEADNVWFEVRLTTGEQGWICSQYLQVSETTPEE
jgi:hypothetical protein